MPLWSDGMSGRPRRLIIVRRGETALFEFLQKQFAEPDTLVFWDRRAADRRQDPSLNRRADDRRRGDRRFPESEVALNERGFFVTREVWRKEA